MVQEFTVERKIKFGYTIVTTTGSGNCKEKIPSSKANIWSWEEVGKVGETGQKRAKDSQRTEWSNHSFRHEVCHMDTSTYLDG
jgi:hypothetical protein